MNHNSFEKNGFLIIKFPQNIKKVMEKEIKEMCLKKLNSQKIRKKNFNEISKSIINLADSNFISNFGPSANRIFSATATHLLNEWVQNFIPSFFKRKKAFLHYVADHELKKNKSLIKKQYHAAFRIVRPKRKSDVGGIHRDSDYWKYVPENNNFKAPIKYKHRIKIWLPIWGCNKSNSLKIVKKTHLMKKIKFKKIKKQKKLKPLIDSNFLKKNKKLIKEPIKNYKNSAIIFHDRLVHFAPVNNSKTLRISSDFTIVTN